MKKLVLLLTLFVSLLSAETRADSFVPKQSYADKPVQISVEGIVWNEIEYPIIRPGTVIASKWDAGPDVSILYFPDKRFGLGLFADFGTPTIEIETTEGSVPLAKINYQAGAMLRLCSPLGESGIIFSLDLALAYTDISGDYLDNGKSRWSFMWSPGIDIPFDDTFAVSAEYRIPWNIEFDANPPNIRVHWNIGDSAVSWRGEALIGLSMRP